MNAVHPGEKITHPARAEQLQFLRFLAFLNVFIYHSDAWNVYGYPSSNAGSYAVSFFFILSGLVTAYSGYGKEIRLGVKPYFQYMWKKLRKIYPLYFATLIFSVVFSSLPTHISNLNFEAALPVLLDLGKASLLIQSWFTEGYFAINGVGWFVSTLMFLSLLNLPCLYLLNKLDRHPWRLLILLGSMGILLFAILFYCYSTQTWDMNYWQYIFPPARAGEYLCGMILGVLVRIIQQKIPAGRITTVLFTLLEVAAILVWLYFLTMYGGAWRRKIVNWLIPNLFLLGVFTFGLGGLSKLFRFRPLVRLGDVSYECFLIHNIIVIRYSFYNDVTMDSPLSCMIATLLCLGLTVLLAFQLSKSTPAKARR